MLFSQSDITGADIQFSFLHPKKSIIFTDIFYDYIFFVPHN